MCKPACPNAICPAYPPTMFHALASSAPSKTWKSRSRWYCWVVLPIRSAAKTVGTRNCSVVRNRALGLANESALVDMVGESACIMLF